MKTLTERTLLKAETVETTTYRVYESNAGILSMMIYREDLTTAKLFGACLDIHPKDIKSCIDDLGMWETWEGLANVKTQAAELKEITNFERIVEESRVTSLGLVRYTYFGDMCEEASRAFKFRQAEIFGGKPTAPQYALPILQDYISGESFKRHSKPCRVPGFSTPVSRVSFIGNLLFSYATPIAKIDYKKKDLLLKAQRFSQTTSRIQNALESLAGMKGYTVYYVENEAWSKVVKA